MTNCIGMMPNMGAQPGYEYGQQYAKMVGLELAHQQAIQGMIVPVPTYDNQHAFMNKPSLEQTIDFWKKTYLTTLDWALKDGGVTNADALAFDLAEAALKSLAKSSSEGQLNEHLH